MPDDQATPLRYTVRRFNWRWAGRCFIRAPGETRVAWFDTPAEAEADRRRREEEVRGRVNPFRCGPALHYLTTLPGPVFRDWLEDAGLTPPPAQTWNADLWSDWWDRLKPTLTADQAARVWDGLNRVRFHDVITRRTTEVAYAVVRVLWDWNDSWYESGDEGGRPMIAFRSREKAEAERRRLEEAEREQWGRDSGWFGMRRWDETNWPWPGKDVGSDVPHDQLPCFEVVEIDLGGAG